VFVNTIEGISKDTVAARDRSRNFCKPVTTLDFHHLIQSRYGAASRPATHVFAPVVDTARALALLVFTASANARITSAQALRVAQAVLVISVEWIS
jgi:hypothetical protein